MPVMSTHPRIPGRLAWRRYGTVCVVALGLMSALGTSGCGTAVDAGPHAQPADQGVSVPTGKAPGLKAFDASEDPFLETGIPHTSVTDLAAGRAQVGFQLRAMRSLAQGLRVYATEKGRVAASEEGVVMVVPSSRLGPFWLLERPAGPLTQASLVDSVNVCTNCDYGKEIMLSDGSPGIVTRVPDVATTVSWINEGVLFAVMGPYDLGPERAVEIANDVE